MFKILLKNSSDFEINATKMNIMRNLPYLTFFLKYFLNFLTFAI